MVLIVAVVLSALAVPLAGGRLGALADLRLRRQWALAGALAVTLAGTGLPGLADGLRAALVVAAYPLGAVFLAANRHVPGMALTAVGAALNLLAIGANGGVMPASPEAMARAGLPLDEPGFQNSAVLDRPRLEFLGDVLAVPASWPLSNVFSVGDVLIWLGLAWGAHRVCGSRLVPRWTPPGGDGPAPNSGAAAGRPG
jgi:Family of unknown function (DUF5317)